MLIQYFGLELIELVAFIAIVILIMLVLDTIFLKIALGIVKSKHTDFGDVFVTALICALVGWIPCLGWILCWVVISSRHETGFLMAIVVWILSILVSFIIGIVVAVALVGLIFGASVIWPF